MSYFAKFFFFFTLIASIIFPQDESQTIATVGGKPISVFEFKNRFEFMPFYSEFRKDEDTLRLQFVYSLIAEKLWSNNAKAMGLEEDENYKISLELLKKLFVVDELYKNKIESKIKISEEEVFEGLKYEPIELELKIFSSTDSATIHKFYSQILITRNIDSVYYAWNRKGNLSKANRNVKFGSLRDEILERELFSLNVGEFIKPYRADEGWFISILENKIIDEVLEADKERLRNIVFTKIRERKSFQLTEKFLNNLLAEQRVEVDRNLFNQLTKLIYELLIKNKGETNVPLEESIVLQIINHLDKNTLEKPFVLMDIDSPSYVKFLYYLLNEKIKFSEVKLNQISYEMSKVVRKFIEQEILYRYALNQNLANSKSVTESLESWKNYLLAMNLMNRYRDSVRVSEEEIEKEKAIRGKGSSMLNIAKILSTDLNVIEAVLKELRDGTDFQTLAKKYSEDLVTRDNGGITGYFNPHFAGEIGRVALSLSKDEVHGPIRTENGFVVIKLLSKKEEELKPAEVSIEIEEQIKRELFTKKIDEKINSVTAELAKSQGFEINKEILKELQLSEISTFIFRLIGFGGRISALPLTIPLYEWKKILEAPQEKLP